jgi:hypothetical protein
MKRVTSNPKDKTHAKAAQAKTFPSARGISLALREGTLSMVRKQMIEDGISYLNDLVQVLVLLWSSDRLSKRLASAKPTPSKGPFKEEKNVRIRSEVLSAAHEAARRVRFDGGATELCRFLLEGYGEGRIELCLRRGGSE